MCVDFCVFWMGLWNIMFGRTLVVLITEWINMRGRVGKLVNLLDTLRGKSMSSDSRGDNMVYIYSNYEYIISGNTISNATS